MCHDKCHFLFYLHRLLKRRYSYITYCYTTGKRVVSPQAIPNNYAFAAAPVDIVIFVTFVTSYFETI